MCHKIMNDPVLVMKNINGSWLGACVRRVVFHFIFFPISESAISYTLDWYSRELNE